MTNKSDSGIGATMKVKVVTQHHGEGAFPTFTRGTAVVMEEECTHFLHWFPCKINGHETYVPELYVTDGKLNRDYNPTELIVKEDDMLEVHDIVNAWLIATDKNGITGWIPAESVVSILSSDTKKKTS